MRFSFCKKSTSMLDNSSAEAFAQKIAMLKGNDQVCELQLVLARQYMRLEQLRIHFQELAPDTYAANEAVKFIDDARHYIRKLEAIRDRLRHESGLFMSIDG